MSPEYRVEIVAPLVYKVQAENKEAAAAKAWELFGDGNEGVDPLAPAEVESVEEVKAESQSIKVAHTVSHHHIQGPNIPPYP